MTIPIPTATPISTERRIPFDYTMEILPSTTVSDAINFLNEYLNHAVRTTSCEKLRGICIEFREWEVKDHSGLHPCAVLESWKEKIDAIQGVISIPPFKILIG